MVFGGIVKFRLTQVRTFNQFPPLGELSNYHKSLIKNYHKSNLPSFTTKNYKKKYYHKILSPIWILKPSCCDSSKGFSKIIGFCFPRAPLATYVFNLSTVFLIWVVAQYFYIRKVCMIIIYESQSMNHADSPYYMYHIYLEPYHMSYIILTIYYRSCKVESSYIAYIIKAI